MRSVVLMADSVEERFAAIVAALSAEPGVMLPSRAVAGKPRRFGDETLRVDGKIFAMLSRGTLVVKVPRQRVDALIAKNDGITFDAGRGRPMREWLAVDPSEKVDWLAIVREAFVFVRSVKRRV
ncbi:MAG: MmcQ/YjbR family DNA-binding protein [Candidatus Eremiobacteraeota bacterium]|nr:MmcQ/YjbR family DNA-binding protein [Candidatus Eremiobacteraeota bacterium]